MIRYRVTIRKKVTRIRDTPGGNMSKTVRYGVSLEKSLSDKFDALITRKKYPSRSEAIRDLIRNYLVEEEWKVGKKDVVGTITIVYNHKQRELGKNLTSSQHKHHNHVISAMHVHLDRNNCLEVLVVRGKPDKIREIGDRLLGTKGVKHGKLVMTTTGRDIT